MDYENLHKLHEVFNNLKELLNEASKFSKEAQKKYPNLFLLMSLTRNALSTAIPVVGQANFFATASVDLYTHLYTKTYKHKQYEFCDGTLIERPYRHTYKDLTPADIHFIEEDERDLGFKQNIFVNAWTNEKSQEKRALLAAREEDHHKYITDLLIYMTIINYYNYKDIEKINSELEKYIEKKDYITWLKYEPEDPSRKKKKRKPFSGIAGFISANQKICEVFENLEHFEKLSKFPRYSNKFFKGTLEYLLRRHELNMSKSCLSLLYDFIASFDTKKFDDEHEELKHLKEDVYSIAKICQILTDDSKLITLKESTKTFQKNSYVFQEFLDSHNEFKALVESSVKEIELLRNDLVNSLCPTLRFFKQFSTNQKLELSLMIRQDKDLSKFLENIVDLGEDFISQYDFETLKEEIFSLLSLEKRTSNKKHNSMSY